jgi:hypothetical protein
MTKTSNTYTSLIEEFLIFEKSVEDFTKEYKSAYLHEKGGLDDDLFDILDELFVYVYGYTKDSELIRFQPDYHFNENQLRQIANISLKKLRALK